MPPVLSTESAFLRELLLNDVEPLAALLAQVSAPDAYDLPEPSGLRTWIGRQQEAYRTEGLGLWAVIDREAAVLVGLAGLTARDFGEPGTRELFCLIEASARRRGLGREVLAAVRDRAFEDDSIARLALLLPPGEAPAERLALGLTTRVERRETHLSNRSFVVVFASREPS